MSVYRTIGPLVLLTVTLRGVSNKHCLLPLFSFLAVFYPILFILAGNDDMHESWRSSKLGQIRPPTAELAALERLKKSPDL